MGLFDKKKKGDDDYDSPVEQVNLSAPKAPLPGMPPAPARGAVPPPTQQAPITTSASAVAVPPPATPAPAAVAAPPAPAPRPRAPEPEYDVPNYGIDKAIELMRLLPADNIELVVQVVKKTLESLQIQVPSIIKDATRKQQDIEGRVGVLNREIAELEAEISTRRTEINALEADHKETTTVKERLILAEKLTEERKGSAPATAGTPSSATTTPAAPRPSGSYSTQAPRNTEPPPTGTPGTGPTKK